jgi:hypothetical protein
MTALTTPLESAVHRQLCDFVRLKWPDAIFNSDGAGNNLSPAQAGMSKMLRCAAGFPDWFLAEPRGVYHGLFLEIKREGTTLYLRDGRLSTNAHIQEQAEMLQKLMNRGYYANFAQGIAPAVNQVQMYMGLEPGERMGGDYFDSGYGHG